jgi:hypothetical protein
MQSVVATLAWLCSANRMKVLAAADCIRAWREFGDSMLELQAVAVRLLSSHAIRAATERNWSLRERMYCASHTWLGMQRANAVIAICAAEKAKIDPTLEFVLECLGKNKLS